MLGGVALMTFGVIILSGINILKNCEMGNRETTIVGISLAVGIGFSAVADSLAAFPFWVTSMLSGLPGTRHHRHPAQRPDPRRKEGERHRIRIGGSS